MRIERWGISRLCLTVLFCSLCLISFFLGVCVFHVSYLFDCFCLSTFFSLSCNWFGLLNGLTFSQLPQAHASFAKAIKLNHKDAGLCTSYALVCMILGDINSAVISLHEVNIPLPSPLQLPFLSLPSIRPSVSIPRSSPSWYYLTSRP